MKNPCKDCLLYVICKDNFLQNYLNMFVVERALLAIAQKCPFLLKYLTYKVHHIGDNILHNPLTEEFFPSSTYLSKMLRKLNGY